jgi:phenylpyruvate tautomerase PptA (4-oxalocrotonate tautomerase family)
MPQFLIEAPTGASSAAKQRMMKSITEAIDDAYAHFGDIRIWLREYLAENVAQDGKIGAEPVRPLCFLEAPELSNLEAKRKLAARVHAAIEDAYRGLANTEETLILMNHYPLENAGWAGRLQSDNREAVAAVKSLNGR